MNDDLRDLAADLAGAGIRATFAASAVVVATANATRDLAGEFAVLGPTLQWWEGMRAYAHGTERNLAAGDLDADVTNVDWAAHIIEFGTATRAPLAAIGPAADRMGPRLVDGLAEVAARSVLGKLR